MLVLGSDWRCHLGGSAVGRREVAEPKDKKTFGLVGGDLGWRDNWPLDTHEKRSENQRKGDGRNKAGSDNWPIQQWRAMGRVSDLHPVAL